MTGSEERARAQGLSPAPDTGAGAAKAGTAAGTEAGQAALTAVYGAPGTPVAGMRLIRSDRELPREVLDYVELVESNRPRAAKEQHALVRYIRRTFCRERLYIDLDRLGKYLGLQRYFPFSLFPWQKFLIALWLCTYTEDGRVRWKKCFALLARGAGKDGFIAYVATCLVSPYNPAKRYDVDICANDETQATRPVEDIVGVLEDAGQATKLARFFHHTKELVQGLKNRGKVRGWTNNAKNRDGLRSGLIVFNEVHQFQNYKNIKVFKTGKGKVQDPREGIFSSNGEVNDGPLDDFINQGMRILFEDEDDHGFLPFICRLESKAQVDDPENWSMANPSWAYLPTLREETEEEYRDFLEHPEQNGDFLSKRMGLRAGFSELAVTDYDKILATKKPLPDLRKWACVAGLDYAELNDWASVVLLFKRGEKRYVLCHTWICEQSKTLHRVQAPWEDWVRAGYCTLVREPTINPALLGDWLQAQGRQYRVKKLAMDNFRWTSVGDAMIKAGFDAKDKKRVKLVRPSDIMQVEPLIQQCFDRDLWAWGDYPPLRWAVNNTKRVPASRSSGSDTGNFYYAKIEAKSRKTDPWMALVAAMTIEGDIGRSTPLRMPPPPIILN